VEAVAYSLMIVLYFEQEKKMYTSLMKYCLIVYTRESYSKEWSYKMIAMCGRHGFSSTPVLGESEWR